MDSIRHSQTNQQRARADPPPGQHAAAPHQSDQMRTEPIGAAHKADASKKPAVAAQPERRIDSKAR